MRHFCFQKHKAIELHSFSKTAATLFIPKCQFLLNISNHKNNFFGYWIIFNLCTWNEKMLSNYWTKVWNSGHGVYPDSRKRKGFMHKIITKIIEPTKTITQSMKKQFVTWFIRFCPCKNRDEVLLTLGCLNVKLLNPWVIFVKVLWNRYCRIQCTEKKSLADFDFAIQNFNQLLVPIFGHFDLPTQKSDILYGRSQKIHFHSLYCKDCKDF